MTDYYYQNRNGRRVRVRKNNSDRYVKDRYIAAATRTGATTGGFIAGTGLGVLASRVIKKPAIRPALLTMGALSTSIGAALLAERSLIKRNIPDE